MPERVVSLWFPRLPSDRVLRARPTDTPFALVLHQQNTDRLYCLNRAAEAQGLHRGMGYSDAHAFCPDLQSCPADLPADRRFLLMLARWAKRYCPWVGLDGADGLVMNITGSAHLFGGEEAMLSNMRLGLARAGINPRFGLADTRGAAWALAHFDQGTAASKETRARLATLPVAALRLTDKTSIALQRLGVRRIADLLKLPRATVTRRFGMDAMLR
ncbi:MAG: DNA polymerase Y family protein, partial [Alphaproteobacteria bacterium]|nr:DNA polymerase Y family protein [Alphaproteobacteria bacterium]